MDSYARVFFLIAYVEYLLVGLAVSVCVCVCLIYLSHAAYT